MTADRDELLRAYDEAVQKHGRGLAVEAVEAATGQFFVGETPPDKIAATIAALRNIKPVAKARISFQPKQSVADRLNEMARAIYARR